MIFIPIDWFTHSVVIFCVNFNSPDHPIIRWCTSNSYKMGRSVIFDVFTKFKGDMPKSEVNTIEYSTSTMLCFQLVCVDIVWAVWLLMRVIWNSQAGKPITVGLCQ